MDYLQVTFRVNVPPAEADSFVEAVLLEQTVETPADVARRNAFVREHMMGEIYEIRPLASDAVLATLRLPVATSGADPAQFLNVLFGNVSLHEHVTLEEFHLSPALQSLFSGPRHGITGIRRRMGVMNRPLTCAVLKPVGLPPEGLADLCRTFAEGGIDVIKDDHYFADQPFCPFEERVRACQEVVEEVSARSGRTVIYCPNLSGTPDDIVRQIEYAQERGVGAVMLAPAIVGLPFVHQIVQSQLDVPLLAHPSFAGSVRIRTETYLGRLFRLFGADAVIFANYGGRFSYSAERCGHIAAELRCPWDTISSSLPAPAGGMSVDRAPELIDFFGNDTMLLVGGSLLSAGETALRERTQTFTEAVASAAEHVNASSAR